MACNCICVDTIYWCVSDRRNGGVKYKRMRFGVAFLIMVPAIVLAGMRSFNYAIAYCQVNYKKLSEKWRLFRNATFSDFIKGSIF